MDNITVQLCNQMIETINGIEENLCDPYISDLIEKHNYSDSRFRELFRLATEMTPIEYIRKRRLTEIAKEIKNNHSKVLDAAFKFGFKSESAFYEAFKKEFGISPGEIENVNITFFEKDGVVSYINDLKQFFENISKTVLKDVIFKIDKKDNGLNSDIIIDRLATYRVLKNFQPLELPSILYCGLEDDIEDVETMTLFANYMKVNNTSTIVIKEEDCKMLSIFNLSQHIFDYHPYVEINNQQYFHIKDDLLKTFDIDKTDDIKQTDIASYSTIFAYYGISEMDRYYADMLVDKTPGITDIQNDILRYLILIEHTISFNIKYSELLSNINKFLKTPISFDELLKELDTLNDKKYIFNRKYQYGIFKDSSLAGDVINDI